MTRSAAVGGGVWWTATCLGALLCAAPVSAGAQTPSTQPPTTQPPTTPAPGTRQAAPAATTAIRPATLDYRIGAGDALHLFVWKEPELTREVTVRIDGKITVPLLGDLQAAGKAPNELGEEVTAGLKRFLAAPVVTVAVNQTRSTRFFVVGMVGKSGEFSMIAPTTVVQALAVAGGLRDYAKLDEILILRPEGDATKFIPVNYKRLVSNRDWSQNITLRSGDTVVVP